MRDFNVNYNYIPKSPQLVDQKCMLELTVLEDFLAISREMSNRRHSPIPLNP